jgi:hypothetical protein
LRPHPQTAFDTVVGVWGFSSSELARFAGSVGLVDDRVVRDCSPTDWVLDVVALLIVGI